MFNLKKNLEKKMKNVSFFFFRHTVLLQDVEDYVLLSNQYNKYFVKFQIIIKFSPKKKQKNKQTKNQTKNKKHLQIRSFKYGVRVMVYCGGQLL